MYVNYSIKSGPKNSKFYQAVNDGVDKFVCDIEKYSEKKYAQIPDDEPKNCGKDIEASLLCQGIWARLMNHDEVSKEILCDNNIVWISQQDKTHSVLFHLDIMNNPKIDDKNNIASCGLFNESNKNNLICLNEVYHSIGNIAPIPWFPLRGNHHINGQLLHKAVDERWDFYLQLLKDNWSKWNTVPELTFEKYMVITGQQMYYQEIFDEIVSKSKKIGKNDIRRWNSMICPKKQLVNLSPNGNKTKQIIENILKVIRVRCQVIYILLKNFKQEV